ncbi:MAG: 4-hydroxy-tetrahydrodipicolinate reductase [Kiritimatiellae bacterium]|jgi:4-hydroxy-tetrahydrodipicolinate reductase|nr:4-hydroxy-tetrahydrodipicolinate reductase [Kiritimatiellia bacterium]
MVKVVIVGAGGRMGKALIQAVVAKEDTVLYGAVDLPENPNLGKDAGELAGCETQNVALTDNLLNALEGADVLIDFTFHAAVPNNIKIAAEKHCAVVIGTTGLTPEETEVVRKESFKIPVVWAPNMSVGVNLLFALTKKVAEILGPDYDAEIVEMHHRHKQDAPSGTAMRIAESLAEGRKRQLADVACYGRQGITGERPKGEIGIHTLRGGDVIGDHTVIFAGDSERFELTHKASDRGVFANGAVFAASWITDKKPRIYDMQDILGLS